MSKMAMKLQIGDKVEIKGRECKVMELTLLEMNTVRIEVLMKCGSQIKEVCKFYDVMDVLKVVGT